jgi:hypothetical protein
MIIRIEDQYGVAVEAFQNGQFFYTVDEAIDAALAISGSDIKRAVPSAGQKPRVTSR